MKQRTIHNEDQRLKASQALLGITPPFVVSVTEGTKIRTDGQNRRYWSSVTFFMEQIDEAVERLSERTGYTNYEARKVIAEELPVEHATILFMRKEEAIHECLKMICHIPTSTRLGTKSFQKFEQVLEQTMAEILGGVESVSRAA